MPEESSASLDAKKKKGANGKSPWGQMANTVNQRGEEDKVAGMRAQGGAARAKEEVVLAQTRKVISVDEY